MKLRSSLILFLSLVAQAPVFGVEQINLSTVVKILDENIAPENLECSEDENPNFNKYRVKQDKEKFLEFYKLLNSYNAASSNSKKEVFPKLKAAFSEIAGNDCSMTVSTPLGPRDQLGDVLMINCPVRAGGAERSYFLFPEGNHWSIEGTSFDLRLKFRNREGYNKALMYLHQDHLFMSKTYPESVGKSIFPHIEYEPASIP